MGVPFWKGEHQFVEALGKDKARALLEKHWDTWVGGWVGGYMGWWAGGCGLSI